MNQAFLVLAQMVGVIEGSDSLKIEIKCPYSAWDLEVEKACTKSNFYSTLDNSEFHLSRNHHKYYYQILLNRKPSSSSFTSSVIVLASTFGDSVCVATSFAEIRPGFTKTSLSTVFNFIMSSQVVLTWCSGLILTVIPTECDFLEGGSQQTFGGAP